MLFRFLVIVASLAAVPTAARADITSTIDRIIDAGGLASLEGQQRIAARTLIARILAANAESNTLSASSEKYMRKMGYEPVYLSVLQSNGKYYLIAKGDFSSYATSDLPLLMPTMLFSNGQYYSKPNIIGGGITEFIDKDGAIQSFMFAKWFRLN